MGDASEIKAWARPTASGKTSDQKAVPSDPVNIGNRETRSSIKNLLGDLKW